MSSDYVVLPAAKHAGQWIINFLLVSFVKYGHLEGCLLGDNIDLGVPPWCPADLPDKHTVQNQNQINPTK